MKHLKSYFTVDNAIVLVAFLVTASWVWGTIEAIQKNFALQQQVDALVQQNAYHELENETLEFQKRYYQTSEYLDLSARERLNVAAPGEKVLILPPNTVSATPDDSEVPSVKPISKRSNFEQWIYFLLGSKE